MFAIDADALEQELNRIYYKYMHPNDNHPFGTPYGGQVVGDVARHFRMWVKKNGVDAVPVVHGRWIPHTIYAADDCSDSIGLAGYKCSVCGRFESEKEPYCNCGARMDGDDK